MRSVIYEDSQGKRYEIPANTPFKKGDDWKIVDVIIGPEEQALGETFSRLAQLFGTSVDVIITKTAEALKIEKCPACQLRSQILKRMGELGWIETMRRLRATFNVK